MVKFENRVAQTKISRFIETSPLVIFLNGKSTGYSQEKAKSYFHKKLTKSLAEAYNSSKNSLKKKSRLSEKEYIDLQCKALQIKSVKNKYVKKALSKKPFFNYDNSTLALTQGNNLLITLQPITFFLLKELSEDKSVSILGAIYKNCSIDHNQILKLSKVIEEDQIYYNLNNLLKNNLSSLIFLIKNASSTRCSFTEASNNVSAKLCFTLACLQKKLLKDEGKSKVFTEDIIEK